MITKTHFKFSLIAVLFILTSCLDTGNAGYDDTQDQAYLQEYAQREEVTTTASGLMYRVLEEGEEGGESPTASQYSIIKYEGESVDRAFVYDTEDSFEMIIPNNLVNFIGLGEGVQYMSEGDRYEFVLPTNLATKDGRVYIFQVRLESFLRKDQEQFLVDNAELEDVEETSSGLQYRIIEEGDGNTPGQLSTVSIRYIGSYTNGYIFDQTKDDETTEIGVDEVIPGFSEGLRLMKEGGKYEFFIPPELGYGDNHPQYGTVLTFEVELAEVL